MKFPETSRKGDPSELSATARLAGARDEERRLADEAQAAEGSADHPAAESRLTDAQAEVATSKAWLGWIERGV